MIYPEQDIYIFIWPNFKAKSWIDYRSSEGIFVLSHKESEMYSLCPIAEVTYTKHISVFYCSSNGENSI